MTTDREKLANRVRALMAMATHPASNPEEAAVAAAKASELILKYNLEAWEDELAGVKPGEGFIRQIFRNFQFNSVAPRTLLRVLCQYNFCKHVQITSEGKVAFSLVGKPSNIDAVIYLFNYMTTELNRIERVALKTRRADIFAPYISNSKHWTAFWYGAVDAIATKLYEQRQAAEASEANVTALILVSDEALTAAVNEFHPNTHQVKPRAVKVDSRAMKAGWEAGYNLNVAPKLPSKTDRG